MLANLCWLPAISVPAGLSASGFPVGLQIVCPRWRDDIALRLGRILELAQPWPHRAPAYRNA
jgi:aspartyl-tRNA(Asn)/glutamyl-tRNA(Gln) amidotransferase subunit A